MSNTAKLTLAPQTIEGSTDVVKGMLEAVKSQTGFVPNMYANMANLPGLLDTYQAGYKHFREDGIFTSVEQEVVLLTVSRFNACTYCMAAHSMIASKVSHVPEDVLKALRSGAAIPDPALAVLSSFTEVMLRQRGNPSEEQLGQFRAAGFSELQVMGIVLAIAVKTLSNYTNHLFHTAVDSPFRAFEWNSET